MARYIDADELIEALRTDFDREGAIANEMAMKGLADASVKYGHGQFCYLNAMERVKDMPTADVAPKSEVARLIEDFQRSIRADAKVGMSAGEILLHINNMLIKLKKEYTEERE